MTEQTESLFADLEKCCLSVSTSQFPWWGTRRPQKTSKDNLLGKSLQSVGCCSNSILKKVTGGFRLWWQSWLLLLPRSGAVKQRRSNYLHKSVLPRVHSAALCSNRVRSSAESKRLLHDFSTAAFNPLKKKLWEVGADERNKHKTFYMFGSVVSCNVT